MALPPPPAEAAAEKRTVTVEDPRVAEILLSLDRHRAMAMFLEGTYSLTEVAEALDMHLPTLHHQVQRLLALGLVEVAAVEPRRGRPIKRYRATADRFLVPFELSNADTIESLMEELTTAPRRRFIRNMVRHLTHHRADWDFIMEYLPEHNAVTVSMNARGETRSHEEILLNPDMPAIGLAWTQMELPFDVAKELQRELFELFGKYQKRQVPGEQRYLLQHGITPADES